MSLVKWTIIGLVALPAGEIAVFLVLALTIGWLWTMGLFLATSAIGVLVLRHSGRKDLERFRAALEKDGLRAIHLESPGLAAMVGGILLVFPGFITDAIGVLLFIPPLRRWFAAAIRRVSRKRQTGPRDREIIDLPPDQWHQVPDPTIEDQTRRRKLGS
jgi:UPF0716 protein FxsA